MLRFKILASAVPLILVTALAHTVLSARPHPCIAIADLAVQIASVPWQAQLHVSFTDEPLSATIRVQIADNAAEADFAVVDDVEGREAGACEEGGASRLIAISARSSAAAPVIYLSHDGPADYRIFVHSRTFTEREAAALIVGARTGYQRLQTASL